MLQIVFGDSECGSLKMAQHIGPSTLDGPFAVILQNDDGTELSQEEQDREMARIKTQWERENCRARPVGGDPGDVLCPSNNLDIGPLSGPDEERVRFDLLTAMLGGRLPFPEQDPDDHGQRDMMWEGLRRDSAALLDRAGKGEPVRIWYSRAPYSLCGLYDTVWRLRKFDCPVTVIELPRYSLVENGVVTSSVGWGDLPRRLGGVLTPGAGGSKPICRAMAMEWAQLRQENAPLRAVVNGRLQSVEEDFYDSFLRACIPEGEFRVCQLIGDVIGRCRLGISDWWIAKRVQAMLARGDLVLAEKGTAFYRDVVRRA